MPRGGLAESRGVGLLHFIGNSQNVFPSGPHHSVLAQATCKVVWFASALVLAVLFVFYVVHSNKYGFNLYFPIV